MSNKRPILADTFLIASACEALVPEPASITSKSILKWATEAGAIVPPAHPEVDLRRLADWLAAKTGSSTGNDDVSQLKAAVMQASLKIIRGRIDWVDTR